MKKISTFLIFVAVCTSFGNAQTVKSVPVKVRVINNAGFAIPNDKILFVGQKTGKVIAGITDVRGTFSTQIPSGDTYSIKIDAIGEELDYNTLEVPNIPDDSEFGVMEIQIFYDLPEMITLSNLHFQTGKSLIQPESYPTLDKLAEYMKRKPLMNIRIEGHTDNQGSDASNLVLSEQRAESVRKYLISKGVTESRIVTKGKGASQPIADNSSAQGRAKNRRTEIHIVSK